MPSDDDELENPSASMTHFKVGEMEAFRHKQEDLAKSYENLLGQHIELLQEVIDAHVQA